MAEKTITQLVIDALMTGRALKTSDIAELIERKASNKDISSLLSKISNENRCSLGNFIERNQEKGIFVYKIVKEALKLSQEQAYGLSLKTGYTLEQALNDYPELQKYVSAERKAEKKSEKPKKAAAPKKKPVAKKKAEKKKPVKKIDVAVPAKKAPAPALSAGDAEKMLAGVIKKIADGDLNINLNLSVKLEK